MGREVPQVADSLAASSSGKPGGCPFGHGASAPSAQTVLSPVQADSQPGVCPMSPPEAQANGSASSARCPYGYDSQSDNAKLTALHCMLCESLLYRCVAAQPCSHRFCRSCIAPFQDCPACGRDIDTLDEDSAYQGEVEQFIQTHVERPTLLVTDEPAPAQANAMSPAAFLLELGLTSLAGRNFDAALHWLGACKELLLEPAASQDIDESQLGAVCGSQGDCCRQLGDVQAAAEHYHESIRHLRRVSESQIEAAQAIPISLNKLGDLQYWQGDVRSARDWYAQALQERQQLLSSSHSTADAHVTEHVARLVDVGISLGKVMDADRALGEEAAAMDHHAQAVQIMQDVQADISRSDVTVQKKYAALHALLHPTGPG